MNKIIMTGRLFCLMDISSSICTRTIAVYKYRNRLCRLFEYRISSNKRRTLQLFEYGTKENNFSAVHNYHVLSINL